MMKRIMTGLVAISAAFVLNACGASCEDACNNAAEKCLTALGQEAVDAAKAQCATSCAAEPKEGEAACKDESAYYDCAASAENCEAVSACASKC